MALFLGIDIGNCYTKVVALERKPAVRLLLCLHFKTPYIPQGQAGQNPIDIKKFWQEITPHIPAEKIRASTIGVNLSSSAITAMTLILPRMARNEIRIASQNEAKRKMIPASGPQHIFETAVIGTAIVAKIPRYEVLIARSESVYVKRLLELFAQIHAHPSLIAFCSSTLFTLLPAEIIAKKDVDAAFVDIGLHSICTSILKEGKLNFFRNTAFGLKDAYEDIAKNLSLSENEAEGIIRQHGVPDVAFDLKDKVAVAEEIMRQKYETASGSQRETINPLELRALWQAHIDRIIHELRRSLTFYKEQSEGRRVEYLYFLGGAAQIKNLVPIIMKQLGGQWQITYPFKDIQAVKAVEDTASTPIFTNAASLALSLLRKEKGIEIIDFLPPELKSKQSLAKRRVLLFILTIAIASCLALFSIATGIQNRILKKKLAMMDESLGSAQATAESLKDLGVQEDTIKQKASILEEIIKQQMDFSRPLTALAKAIPKDVLLTRLSIDKSASSSTMAAVGPPAVDPQAQTDYTAAAAAGVFRITMDAEAFADYEAAAKLFEALRRNLEDAAYFKNIRVSPLKLEKLEPALTGEAVSLTQAMQRKVTIASDMAPVAQ